MKAETITLTITIRPSYGPANTVKKEVEDSLEWLTCDHDAVTLSWGEAGEGEWIDKYDEGEGE